MARPPAKKALIESAAMRLFAKKGIAETTIKDIAAHAGVTDGALYRHYSGKNEMAWQLFCREVQKFSIEFKRVLFRPGRTFEQSLRAGVRFIYEYYSAKPVEFSFILLTQHVFPGKALLDEHLNPNDMVIRFIKQAAAGGNRISGDPVLVCALLMGAVLQPLLMHRYGRLRKDPVKLAPWVSDACLGLLKGRANS